MTKEEIHELRNSIWKCFYAIAVGFYALKIDAGIVQDVGFCIPFNTNDSSFRLGNNGVKITNYLIEQGLIELDNKLVHHQRGLEEKYLLTSEGRELFLELFKGNNPFDFNSGGINFLSKLGIR